MGNYQAYEKYKDSGVEWLGKIPDHWKRSVFRYYFDIQLGKMLQNESQSEHDEEISYLKAIHIRWDKVNIDDLPKMWTSPREKEKYSVKNGDLLISEGGEVGRTALLKDLQEDCIIQNAAHRVRPLSQSKVEYLNYLMRHIADTKWFDILCNKSTIAHLTSEKLGALPLPLPPLDEQEMIANFLDRKTKQIDDLIAKKEAILAKLDEKRSAIISHAVTKGLDLTVPMKDSGIEWLGVIPKHWEINRLRHILKEQLVNGIFKKRDSWGKGNPIVNVFDVFIESNIVDIETLDRVECEEDELSKYSALYGDFFFVRSSLKLEGIGQSATVLESPEPVVFECHLIRGRPNLSLVDAKFLIAYLNCHFTRSFLVSKANQVTMATIDQNKFKDVHIPTPTLDEQKTISKYLEQKTAEIDLQKAKVQEAIERLKEYRTALITNAVTGKIDVRQVSLN